MTEKALQAAVVKLARLLGFRVHFTHDSRRSPAGMPDLLLIHPTRRRVLFVELKSEKGRLTPEQSACLADLLAAGAEAHVIRPADIDRLPSILLGVPSCS